MDFCTRYTVIIIYKALCFDVAQRLMNGAPNETRTHWCRFASLACTRGASRCIMVVSENWVIISLFSHSPHRLQPFHDSVGLNSLSGGISFSFALKSLWTVKNMPFITNHVETSSHTERILVFHIKLSLSVKSFRNQIREPCFDYGSNKYVSISHYWNLENRLSIPPYVSYLNSSSINITKQINVAEFITIIGSLILYIQMMTLKSQVLSMDFFFYFHGTSTRPFYG